MIITLKIAGNGRSDKLREKTTSDIFHIFAGNARFWYHLVISMWVVVCAGQRRFWTRKAIWTRIAKKHPSRMRMPLCAWYQVHTFILILFGLKLILKIYLAWCKQEILSGSDLTVSYFWPVMFPSSHNLQKGRIVRSYDRRWWNWIRVLFALGSWTQKTSSNWAN